MASRGGKMNGATPSRAQSAPARTSLLCAVSLAAAATAGAAAGPTLRLDLTSPATVRAGELVQVTVSMSDLASQNAAGFQAFLHYDNTRLEFLNASYASTPFGLAIIWPITATAGGDIDLAAGINQFIGQTPTAADAVLAYLTFESINGDCQVLDVEFRAHNPPSRLTTTAGEPILPLTLLDLQATVNPCSADVNDSTAVDVLDLLAVINTWGPCPPDPQCCAGDTDNSATVDVLDLLAVINTWGPCPP